MGSDRRECLKVETVDRGMPKKQREDMLRALTESTAVWLAPTGPARMSITARYPSSLMKKSFV